MRGGCFISLFWGFLIFFGVMAIVTLIIYFGVYPSFVKNNKVLVPTQCLVFDVYSRATTCSYSCNCYTSCGSKGSCTTHCQTCYYTCYNHYATLSFSGTLDKVTVNTTQYHTIFLRNNDYPTYVSDTYIPGAFLGCFYNMCPLGPVSNADKVNCVDIVIDPCYINKFDESAAFIASIVLFIITLVVAAADIVFASFAFGKKILKLLSGICDLSKSGYQDRRTSLIARLENNPNYNLVSNPVPPTNPLYGGSPSPNPMNEPVYVPHPNANPEVNSDSDSEGPKNFEVSDDRPVIPPPVTTTSGDAIPTIPPNTIVNNESDSFNSDVDKPK